jgi:hypothetical protein
MRHAGRDERLRCSAALLCFAAAAGLQLQMRLTGVMRWGCPVTRVEFECDATQANTTPRCACRGCVMQHALPHRAEPWHLTCARRGE